MDTEVPKVLVIGYSPKLSGGVVRVTETLLSAYPSMDLHVFHHCYTPKLRALAKFMSSLLTFLFTLPRIRKSYDVLHVIVGSSGDAVRTLPYIWLAKCCGIVTCIQHHKSSDFVFENIPSLFLLSMIKRTWRLPAAHVFLSKRLKSNFETVVFERSGLYVIPNAISTKWIQPPSIASYHSREKDVVFFGRWSWEKGANDLVKASNILTDRAYIECYTNVAQPTIEGRCRLYPWVVEDEVRDIISRAKVLILPSYSEAFPTVLLEACACGTPFVASDLAGILDITEQSGAGITFQAGDINGMINALKVVLDDADQWRAMAESGLHWIKELHPERVSHEWEKTYRLISQ